MTSSWKKPLFALIIIFLCLAGCSPLAAVETTESPTVIIPSASPIPPTPTEAPTVVPTPEVARPTVPVGLRPENATSQVLENGTWVVKNEDGKVTATWNAETKTWDYHAENITVKQIFIGTEVSRSIIEPFLGPLPPDDPATHFIDPATGQSVGYGIGPEITKNGDSATEIFLRFRGSIDIPEKDRPDIGRTLMIFEMPKTPDESVILTVKSSRLGAPNLAVIPDGSIIFDDYSSTPSGIPREKRTETANKHLIGQMLMLVVSHDNADKYKDTIYYDKFLAGDAQARLLFAYMTRTPSEKLVFPGNGESNCINPYIGIPANQMPQP